MATIGGGRWRIGSIRINTQLHTETLTSIETQPCLARVHQTEREEARLVGGGCGDVDGDDGCGWLAVGRRRIGQ